MGVEAKPRDFYSKNWKIIDTINCLSPPGYVGLPFVSRIIYESEKYDAVIYAYNSNGIVFSRENFDACFKRVFERGMRVPVYRVSFYVPIKLEKWLDNTITCERKFVYFFERLDKDTFESEIKDIFGIEMIKKVRLTVSSFMPTDHM